MMARGRCQALAPMFPLLASVVGVLRSSFRTRAALQLETVALRHQINVLRRSQRGRVRLGSFGSLLWTWLRRLWPGWRSALVIVKPETVIAWHRQGFRVYWAWKSRGRPGRPGLAKEAHSQDEFGQSALGAPRIPWGTPQIGISLSQATVAKYMVDTPKLPSQSWRAFLNNHASQLASKDFFVYRR